MAGGGASGGAGGAKQGEGEKSREQRQHQRRSRRENVGEEGDLVLDLGGDVEPAGLRVAEHHFIGRAALGEPAVERVVFHREMKRDAGCEIERRAGHERGAPAAAQRTPPRGQHGKAEDDQRLQADVREAPHVAGSVSADAEHNHEADERGPACPASRGILAPRPAQRNQQGHSGDTAAAEEQVDLIELKKPIACASPRARLVEDGRVHRPEKMRYEGIAQIEGHLRELRAGRRIVKNRARIGKKSALHAVGRERPAEPRRQHQAAGEAGKQGGPPPSPVVPSPAPKRDPAERQRDGVGAGREMSQHPGSEAEGEKRRSRPGGLGVGGAQEEIQRGEDEERRGQLCPREGRVLEENRVQHRQHRERGDGVPTAAKTACQQRGRQKNEAAEHGGEQLEMRKVDPGQGKKHARDDVRQRRPGRHGVERKEEPVVRPAFEEKPGALPVFEPVQRPAATGIRRDEGQPADAPPGHEHLADGEQRLLSGKNLRTRVDRWWLPW